MHDLGELYEQAFKWVVPSLVGFAMRYLQQIAKQITEIRIELAAFRQQTTSFEQRLDRVEAPSTRKK